MAIAEEDKKTIAQEVYDLILNGTDQSIDYGFSDAPMPVPENPEERSKYFLGIIKDDGVKTEAGNMNLDEIFTSFGAEAKKELDEYVEDTSKNTIDSYVQNDVKTEINNYVEEKENALDTYTTEKEGQLDEYAVKKEADIDAHVEDVTIPSFNTAVSQLLKQTQTAAEQALNAASNAGKSASAAEESKKAAAISETNAATSEQNAGESAAVAEESKKAAAISETNAKDSEGKAKESEESASQSATEAEQAKTDMQSALDKIQEMYAAFLLDKKRGGMKVGIPYPWLGKSSTIPERAMICDGRELDKDDPDYADLYAIIGTTYGESEDGTKFRIPNYRDCIDQNGDIDPEVEGVFIRATTKDEDVGKKEFDAIRDITGDISNSVILSAYANDDSSLKNQIRGAFKYTGAGTPAATWSPKDMQSFGMTFASSNVVPTSPEDRPYCIKLLYVIAY